MRPVPIPDALAAGWTDARRITLGAPRGQEDRVRPVEAMVEEPATTGQQAATFSMLIELEPGDLERLQRSGRCWLTMWGAVVPFSFDVPAPTTAEGATDGQVP